MATIPALDIVALGNSAAAYDVTNYFYYNTYLLTILIVTKYYVYTMYAPI